MKFPKKKLKGYSLLETTLVMTVIFIMLGTSYKLYSIITEKTFRVHCKTIQLMKDIPDEYIEISDDNITVKKRYLNISNERMQTIAKEEITN